MSHLCHNVYTQEMAEAQKPTNVSDDAVCIPPSPVTQASTIASIEAANAHDNAQALTGWVRGLRDWATNVKQGGAQHAPPRPKKPAVYRTEVTYADASGAVQTGPHADAGGYYAWVVTIVT